MSQFIDYDQLYPCSYHGTLASRRLVHCFVLIACLWMKIICVWSFYFIVTQIESILPHTLSPSRETNHPLLSFCQVALAHSFVKKCNSWGQNIESKICHLVFVVQETREQGAWWCCVTHVSLDGFLVSKRYLMMSDTRATTQATWINLNKFQ